VNTKFQKIGSTLLGLALFAVLPAGAMAQQVTLNPVGINPWFLGGGSYGGGTAAGNYLMGMAQVIRSEGDYNLQTSQGLINFEEARSKYIENANKWTQAYYQMKEAHDAYVIQRFERNKHSAEALAQAAAAELPRKLTSDELDPVTGKIVWPEPLMDEQYADLRAELDHLFELRAWTSRTAGTAARIHDATRRMLDILRSNIETMPANDFIAARKFIDGLDFSVVTPGMKPVPPPPPPAGGGR